MKHALALFFGLSTMVACRAEPRIIADSARPLLSKSEFEAAGVRVKRADSMSVEDWKKKNECEVGDRRMCSSIPFGIRDGKPSYLWMRCFQWADGTNHFDHSTCNTPLAIAWDDQPIAFTAPSADFAIGESPRTEWIASPWLALDRDGSGCIEDATELFAGFTPLALLDENADGHLDTTDPLFSQLVLWTDENQDKRCTASELTSLTSAGIESIDLHPIDHPQSTPGSYEGETAPLITSKRKARLVDVHLGAL